MKIFYNLKVKSVIMDVEKYEKNYNFSLIEKEVISKLPPIIALNDRRFSYAHEFVSFYNRDPMPTMEHVELVDTYERYQFSIYEQQYQDTIEYVSHSMTNNFINKLYSDIIDSIINSVSVTDSATVCNFIKLPYIIDDAVEIIAQRRLYDPIGQPFILCSDELIRRMSFWQEQKMLNIFNLEDTKSTMPIYYAGSIKNIPLYAVNSYKYKGGDARLSLPFNELIVGFSGTPKSIGNRLCFSYLYRTTDLVGISALNKTIQAMSEYKIAKLGNVSDLYITINIKEE